MNKMSNKTLCNKIGKIIEEFDQNFRERQEVIRGALLALLSNEHVLLLGPPGTAKSLFAKKMCSLLKDNQFFYYLLTRFTVPEEIFGPLSLKALEEDKFERKIDAYLPSVHVAFLDEMFKANSSILNSLLTIINERQYHNGSIVLDVPLLTLFGASNELPTEEENLEALYDRFLFRFSVDNLQEETNFLAVVLGGAGEFQPTTVLHLNELQVLQKQAVTVPFSDGAQRILLELRRHFKEKGLYISDRRWKKVAQVLQIAAASLNRTVVDESLLLLCKDLLWDVPDQRFGLRQLLIPLVGSGGIDTRELRTRVNDLKEFIEDDFAAKLPMSVQCYNCNSTFTTYEEVLEHSQQHKQFRCPECNSRYYFTEFIDHMESQHGWQIRRTRPEKKLRIYLKELGEIEQSYSTVLENTNKTRDKLKDALESNAWLTTKDRTDVLSTFDTIITELKEIENTISDLEELLDVNGKENSE